jgi:Polyketide cyclase / dehydrase and lipid transport
MKHLHGRASSVVRAPVSTCFSLLEAFDRYPDWCGEFVRRVSVVERDGDRRPVRCHVGVHVEQSPFGTDFEFDVAARLDPPHAVHLARIPDAPTDAERFSLDWSLVEAGEVDGVGGTRITLEFAATVPFLPSLLPLPGVGDMVAGALLAAASRELGSSAVPAARAPSSG